MRRTPILGAAASLCLLLGGAACGGDDDGGGDSEAEIVSQLSETLQGDGEGLAKEDADCYAAIIVDEVGVDALKDVDLTADEPPEELQDEIAAAAARLVDECDITDLGG
ncbi:MAG: hypothetical protein ABL966_12085 [Acidimicrobiales bacterium]